MSSSWMHRTSKARWITSGSPRRLTILMKCLGKIQVFSLSSATTRQCQEKCQWYVIRKDYLHISMIQILQNMHRDKELWVKSSDCCECFLFVCLPACLLACLLVCLFVCLFACLFVCLFVCLLVCLFVCLFACCLCLLTFFHRNSCNASPYH